MGQDSQQADNLWLIVGLGNPGTRYAATRHNAGFMAVDELARRHALRFSGKQANAEVAKGSINGVPVVLTKPQTYMNNSGLAVGWLARYYKIPHDRVLVAYDDIALPLGKLRIRTKGSDGGHNGLTSLIHHLGTQKFPRLRIGVDRPVVASHSQIDWVLGRFTKDERKVMDEALVRAAEAIEAVLRDGIDRAMNVYNMDLADPVGNAPKIPEKTPSVGASPESPRPTNPGNNPDIGLNAKIRNLIAKIGAPERDAE